MLRSVMCVPRRGCCCLNRSVPITGSNKLGLQRRKSATLKGHSITQGSFKTLQKRHTLAQCGRLRLFRPQGGCGEGFDPRTPATGLSS